MKGFFEKFRDEDKGISVYRNRNHVYPLHFHSNMELYFCNKSRINLTIDNKKYSLSDGHIAVIDSYAFHSIDFQSKDALQDECCLILPYHLLTTFNKRRKNLKIDCPVIKDKHTCQNILSLIDKYLTKDSSDFIKENTISLILSILIEKLSFSENSSNTEYDLFRKIISFIHENYNLPLSRSYIAQQLGYNESHISRVFHRFIALSINEYTNSLRIDHINRLIENGDERNMTELIFDAGFISPQTYYRVKRKLITKNAIT